MFLLVEEAKNFCHNARDILSLVGTFMTIFKIAIPVLLIVLGSVDLGKAVVASDDKAIKTATSVLVKRIIIGIIIFFIPTIVNVIFKLFTGGEQAYNDANVCISCITGDSKGCK